MCSRNEPPPDHPENPGAGPQDFLRLAEAIKEHGQDLAEYALLVGLIAILVVAAATLLGTNLSTFWNTVVNGLDFLPW